MKDNACSRLAAIYVSLPFDSSRNEQYWEKHFFWKKNATMACCYKFYSTFRLTRMLTAFWMVVFEYTEVWIIFSKQVNIKSDCDPDSERGPRADSMAFIISSSSSHRLTIWARNRVISSFSSVWRFLAEAREWMALNLTCLRADPRADRREYSTSPTFWKIEPPSSPWMICFNFSFWSASWVYLRWYKIVWL